MRSRSSSGKESIDMTGGREKNEEVTGLINGFI